MLRWARQRGRSLRKTARRAPLRELAQPHPRWGAPLLTRLLRRDDFMDDHKRIRRVSAHACDPPQRHKYLTPIAEAYTLRVARHQSQYEGNPRYTC